MNKVSIIIVGYNSKHHIDGVIESIQLQDYWNHEVFFVDNNSRDNSLEYLAEKYPDVKILSLHKNIGFAAANNMAISISKGDYVLLMNPDIRMDSPDVISRLVHSLESDSSIAGVQPKLLRGKQREEGFEKTNIIDSTGDFIKKSRRTFSRGQGKEDTGQYDGEKDIFAPCAALALYRREALAVVKHGEYEFFDEDFFSYKEDIDLAWRLRRIGYNFIFVPTAVAYHFRGWKKGISGRKNVSSLNKFHSLKNRYLLTLKNDNMLIRIIHLPWIFVAELLILMHGLIFERAIMFRAYFFVMRYSLKIREKRIGTSLSFTDQMRWFV